MRRRGAARQGRWSPGEYRFMAHASWQWGVNPVWVAPGRAAGLLAALIIGDPGRIDRQETWLRIVTSAARGADSLP